MALGNLPTLFREAWTFSACTSLASSTARLMGVSDNKPPPTGEPEQSHSQPTSGHRSGCQGMQALPTAEALIFC